MQNYTKALKGQTEGLAEGMVQNNAGGYSFKIEDKNQLERFLTLGSEGNTYYSNKEALTVKNAESIVKLIKSNGPSVVETTVLFYKQGRAIKIDTCIFVLALCTAYGDTTTKSMAYTNISVVCKTGTHLFQFMANIKSLRKWSRGLRKGIANWYLSKTTENLAYQMIKYRNRAGYTHRDVLRLCHAGTKDPSINSLFKFAVGKESGAETGSLLVRRFAKAQTATVEELPALIREGLTWEMVPTNHLNDKDILLALLESMPLNAMVRFLNRFAYNNLTELETSAATVKIVEKLSTVTPSMHPIMLANSLLTYQKGFGDKGDKTWSANGAIVKELIKLYDRSFSELPSSNKKILIGVDVSGSMTQGTVSGTALTPCQIAQMLMVTLLRVEKNADTIWFTDSLHEAKFNKNTSLLEILNAKFPSGGTDCSLPIQYALAKKIKYDAILILTDSETHIGRSINPLKAYRNQINPDVEIIEVGLVANEYSNIHCNDPKSLHIAGFDNNVLNIINMKLGSTKATTAETEE